MKDKKVKICGLAEESNVRAIEALEPDFIGFIFYRGSRRFIDSDKVASFERRGPAKRIGVFVNEDSEVIAGTLDTCNLDGVQLHGDETPEYISRLRRSIGETLVIKAISASETLSRGAIADYESMCDYLLFDTPTPGRGGSGQRFDAALLRDLEITIPFFLSGGLDAGAVKEAASLLEGTKLCGFDFNSKLETAVGIKSVALARQVIEEVRNLHA